MKPFTRLDAIAAPLPLANVDTDKIIPARFLKTTARSGLGSALFDGLRRTPTGEENPDFILNRVPWSRAEILVTLENFGCGSSREHAPWALVDFGIRSLIAPSFADIFYNNCLKNGLLPIILSRHDVEEIISEISDPASSRLSVDLAEEMVNGTSGVYRFRIDPKQKSMLLHGTDEITDSLQHEHEIAAFEQSQRHRGFWLPDLRALQSKLACPSDIAS